MSKNILPDDSVLNHLCNKSAHWDFSGNGDLSELCNNGIRNRIVHHEGRIKEKEKETKDVNAIKPLIQKEFVSLNGNKQINITHEYTVFILKKIYEFIATICNEVFEKYRNKEILN